MAIKLILLIIVLSAERYISLGSYLTRFSWFDKYVVYLNPWLTKAKKWGAYITILLLILPILLVVGAILWLSHKWEFGIINLVLQLLVLWYCLGPYAWYQQMQNDFNVQNIQANNGIAVIDSLSIATPQIADTQHTQTLQIFTQFNSAIFAPVFWFVIVGPLGALLYRMVAIIDQLSTPKDSQMADLKQAANQTLAVLDWLPVRVQGLLFSLAGHFSNGFGCWLDHLVNGLEAQGEYISRCGLAALGLKFSDSHIVNVAEQKEAYALTQRALVMLLVIVALMMIATWVY